MISILNDSVIDLILNTTKNKLEEFKQNYEWKKIFNTTANSLLENKDFSSDRFKKDFKNIFSDKNINDLAIELKNKDFFQLKKILNKKLTTLISQYEIDYIEAETFISYFIQSILNYSIENIPDADIKIFLGDLKTKEDENFKKIKEQIQELNTLIKKLSINRKAIFTINEIDYKLQKETTCSIGLDFFDIDDEDFLIPFHNRIEKKIEKIYITSISKEETFYLVLNEIKKMNFNNLVLIVTSEIEWEKLKNQNIVDKILIPYFCSKEIITIPNNINIFLYENDEPCYSNEKLILKRRLKKNIFNSLRNAGFEYEKINQLLEDTNGLFIPMKKKLFNGALYEKPKWESSSSNSIIVALLCGQWTESEGDKLIIEELSGKTYNDFFSEISNYKNEKEPFILEITSNQKHFKLVSITNFWEELDVKITNEIWEKFVNLLYEVMIDFDSIFEYRLEEHDFMKVITSKSDFSPILKHGMLKSIILRICLKNHNENQYKIDNIIRKILKSITNKEKLAYISRYIEDLCEISPEVVLEYLEQEIQKESNIIELFKLEYKNFPSNYYYTSILWTIEQLLLQKRFVVRAVNLLWKLHDKNIKYHISNSPKEILSKVFCASINMSVLTVEQKIILAENALYNFKSAWEIIFSKLPTSGVSVIGSDLKYPKFRKTDEINILYENEIYKTYIEYLKLCVKYIDSSATRWEMIISKIGIYSLELIEETFKTLLRNLEDISDENKLIIKNKLRWEIYRNRKYKKTEWAICEEKILIFEKIMNKIKFENIIYDYMYIFKYDFEFEFPLLVSNSDNEKNKELSKKEIKTQIQKFKTNNLLLNDLLLRLPKNIDMRIVGKYIALYYDNNIYNDITFDIILNFQNNELIYNYIRYLAYNCNFKNIIKKLKHLKNENHNLIISILEIDFELNNEKALIFSENEKIKYEFWKIRLPFYGEIKKSFFINCINECKTYGNINSYLNIIYYGRDILTPEEIYNFLIFLTHKDNVKLSLINFYQNQQLKEILKILQDSFLKDEKKSENIAKIEIIFFNILDWEDMSCTRKLLEEKIDLYCELIKILFLDKNNQSSNFEIENKQRIKAIFNLFNKIKFCPSPKNLKKWFDELQKKLEIQDQSHLFYHILGNLLPYSDIGKDGYVPCEEARDIIENNYNDDIKNSYICTELNKRGIYSNSAGKEEKKIAEKYKENSNAIRTLYPFTAKIYDDLSEKYKIQSKEERKRKENEY